MTDHPGEHPLPHPALTSQTPLIFTVGKGEALYRHHVAARGPVHFGATGNNRFDDPRCPARHAFGVLYAAADPHCCFIESCGPTTGVPAVSEAYLNRRAMAKLELREDLRFVDLFSTGGLTRIGADGRLFTGSYKNCAALVGGVAGRIRRSRTVSATRPVTTLPERRMRFTRARSPRSMRSRWAL